MTTTPRSHAPLLLAAAALLAVVALVLAWTGGDGPAAEVDPGRGDRAAARDRSSGALEPASPTAVARETVDDAGGGAGGTSAPRPVVPTVVEHGEVTPYTRVRLEGVPNVGAGACVVRVVFAAGPRGGAILHQAVLPVRRDGTVRVGDAAILGAREGASWYAVTLLDGAPGGQAFLVSSATGARFAAVGAREEEAWRPQEPLVGVCVVDAAGEVLWDTEIATRGHLGRFSETWPGCVPMTRSAYDALTFLDLEVGHERAYVPVDAYPLGLDDLVRVPLGGFGDRERELRVVGDRALPKDVRLVLECESRGDFRDYEPQEARTATKVRRTALAWTATNLAPGVYRASLEFGGMFTGGALTVGVADLRVARDAELRFVAPEVHRNLRVRMVLPPDASPVGLRPWQIAPLREGSARRWFPCHRGSALFHWMGPRPTHAAFSGRRGPLFPEEVPIRWESEHLGTIDLSGRRLRRCEVAPADAGVELDFTLDDSIGVRGGANAREAPWCVVELNGVAHLSWWEGAAFTLPVFDRASKARDEPIVYDPLDPRRIGDAERVVLRPRAGEVTRLRLAVEPMRRPRAWAWTGARAPSAEERAALVEGRSPAAPAYALPLVAPYRSAFVDVSVPADVVGLVLQDPHEGRTAYAPRATWSDVLETFQLDWQ